MKIILLHICRLFLGVLFLGAGINGFFVIFGLEPFIATSQEAMILFQFEYLLVAEKSVEVICGLLLLLNRFIPLVLVILSPIVINILLLHLFVDHSLLILALVLSLAFGYLLFCYRSYYSILFETKSKPTL